MSQGSGLFKLSYICFESLIGVVAFLVCALTLAVNFYCDWRFLFSVSY